MSNFEFEAAQLQGEAARRGTFQLQNSAKTLKIGSRRATKVEKREDAFNTTKGAVKGQGDACANAVSRPLRSGLNLHS